MKGDVGTDRIIEKIYSSSWSFFSHFLMDFDSSTNI